MDELCERSGLSREELTTLINGILRNVRVVATSEFTNQIDEAKRLIRGEDDLPYLALALRLGGDAAVWSNDAEFSRQKAVRVISTSEMMELARR